MGMPAGIIAKGLNGHDRAQTAGFQTGRRAEETEQALVDTLTEFTQKFTVILEKGTQGNRDAEHILPVRYGVKEIVSQVQSELYHLFE
jgi:hypothetical protein